MKKATDKLHAKFGGKDSEWPLCRVLGRRDPGAVAIACRHGLFDCPILKTWVMEELSVTCPETVREVELLRWVWKKFAVS